MFDLMQELDAIERAVSRDTETVTATVSRTYAAHATEVWDALTDPERLPRWFYPVTGDLREGGEYQLVGNAGGRILRCEPPSRLEVTFGGPDSILDVRLSQEGERTTLALIHTVPLSIAQSGAGALFVGPGWDGAVLGLGMFLRGVAVGDPIAAANSADVIEFNRGSIDRWVDAIERSGSATGDEITAMREIAVAQYTVVGPQ